MRCQAANIISVRKSSSPFQLVGEILYRRNEGSNMSEFTIPVDKVVQKNRGDSALRASFHSPPCDRVPMHQRTASSLPSFPSFRSSLVCLPSFL